jgi:hypothetical protein
MLVLMCAMRVGGGEGRSFAMVFQSGSLGGGLAVLIFMFLMDGSRLL